MPPTTALIAQLPATRLPGCIGRSRWSRAGSLVPRACLMSAKAATMVSLIDSRRLSWGHVAEMTSSFDKVDHLSGRMDR